jgi:uncharacterized surface protein with fasciclin (FAS1) repeats
LRRTEQFARHDVAMTTPNSYISKKKALLLSTALLLATPAIAHAGPLNGQKCDNPGAMQRANNSKFVCSPEGGRSVWRRIDGATTLTSVINTLPRYSLLATALKQAGLDTTLATGGPYTIFAPRNSAFLALPKATLDYLLDPANVVVLRRVLLHHVVSGSVKSSALSSGTYTMLDGTTVNVVVRQSGITIDDARVTMGDVMSTNGVLHGVSKVLVPTGLVLGS